MISVDERDRILVDDLMHLDGYKKFSDPEKYLCWLHEDWELGKVYILEQLNGENNINMCLFMSAKDEKIIGRRVSTSPGYWEKRSQGPTDFLNLLLYFKDCGIKAEDVIDRCRRFVMYIAMEGDLNGLVVDGKLVVKEKETSSEDLNNEYKDLESLSTEELMKLALEMDKEIDRRKKMLDERKRVEC